MLAPAGPDEPMQFIDVRDVAAFVVRALENRTSGVFNVTGLRGTVTFGKLFEHVAGVVNGRPEIVWFDREAIVRSGLQEWKEIPLWINDAKAMRKLHAVVVERALSSGLTLRPLDDTVRDTLAWAQTRPSDYVMKHGMTPEREAEALSASESSASSL
jgi:2'-hydroxyisoflavone reductase